MKEMKLYVPMSFRRNLGTVEDTDNQSTATPVRLPIPRGMGEGHLDAVQVLRQIGERNR